VIAVQDAPIKAEFDLDLWEPLRNRALAPTFAGRLSDDLELRREFLVGARMMGYELVDLDDLERIAELRAMKPARYPLQPQQLLVADALNAEGYDEMVVEIVRRASKTTTIFLWCLGRCASRSDYLVTFSAQSGVKGTARLREWKTRLDRTCPDPDADLPPWKRGVQRVPARVARHIALFGNDEGLTEQTEPAARGFRVMMGEVGKGIYFDNGSQFLVLKPDAEAYRGEAGDISWADEGQELDPEEGADFVAGVLPLQDTREGAMFVMSGTAGEARVGPFWERVNRLRSGDDIGGVDYCAPEDLEMALIDNTKPANAEFVKRLLRSVHPGIGTLTTLEVMMKRWATLGTPQWAREYLSLWPETYGVAVIDAKQWEAAALLKPKPMPPRVAFGMDIRPGGAYGCIAAAWRDSRGVAYVSIVEHEQSTAWMPGKAQELTKYRGADIAYDAIGEALATSVEMLNRRNPRPRLRVQTYREHAAGCVQIMRDLERGKLRHFNHPGLNYAAGHAAKREPRNSDAGVWLWTSSEDGADVSPLIAATRALRNWDQHYAKKTSVGTATPYMGE